MILLIDSGNTRIKVAWLGDGPLQPVLSVIHDGSLPAELVDAWESQPGPDAVWLCSVGPERIADEIDAACQRLWQVHPFRLRPVALQAGVRNGYRDPAALGADRWAALLGASSLNPGACCIVDCGTAVTLDLLDADGHHLGGQIVPGKQLMRKALGQRTAGIGEHPEGAQGVRFGTTTAEAVSAGIEQAILATIRRFHAEAASLPTMTRPALLLTGGDAPALLPGLRDLDPIHCPDLVLRGLAVAARDPDPS